MAKLLLLDEPFGALDAKVRKELRRWLRQFHDEIHITTVFVTHDQEEALEIADEVVIMNQAKVEQVGTPQEVYDRPATPFVHRFLGNVNILRDANAWGRTGPIHDTGRLGADGLVYVRPHDIEVSPHGSDANGIPAILRAVHSAGPQAQLSFEVIATGEPVDVDVSRSELAQLALKPNDPALLKLRPVHSFQDYAI